MCDHNKPWCVLREVVKPSWGVLRGTMPGLPEDDQPEAFYAGNVSWAWCVLRGLEIDLEVIDLMRFTQVGGEIDK